MLAPRAARRGSPDPETSGLRLACGLGAVAGERVVRGSGSLGPRQRARIIERLGPVVRVVASDSRSQHRNRELALERLRERLADALRIERTRVPTRGSRSAKEKRLSEKRRRSDRKRSRARPTGDE